MIKVFINKTEKLSASRQSQAAHDLLKKNLAELFSVEKELVQIKKDSLGCPYVDYKSGIFVSITHTDGLVACAISDSRVGVDAEKVLKRRKTVEKRVFTAGEIQLIENSEDENTAFFTLWTLKESYLKAIGTGFANNAKDIEFFSIYPDVISDKKQFIFSTEIVDEYVISYCKKEIN